MVKFVASQASVPIQINVVLNWFAKN